MNDFKKLRIWQLGMDILGMRSQMTRSALSIPCNIAEGSAKRSQKEQAHFIETSLASACDLETQSLVVKNWAGEKMIDEQKELVVLEQRCLRAFSIR